MRPRLLPENWPIATAWRKAACTQWRVAAGGLGGAVRTGLDYTAVLAALQAQWPRTFRRLFAGVQVIEAEFMACDYARTSAGASNE